MLKGCGLSLLILAILAGGYMYGFDQVFHRPEGLIFGAISALITFFCIGALSNAWTAWSDWSLINKAEFGLQLNDGCKVAVAGRIRPIGEPMLAPFSHKPCVICEYDICRRREPSSEAGQDNTGSDFAGFLMTPCQIETSSGEVKLLGFPMMEEVPSDCLVTSETVHNARKFLEETEFEDHAGLKIVSVLSVFSEVWSDDDGSVQKHMRLANISHDEMIPFEGDADIDRYNEILDQEEELTDLDEETLDEGARIFSGLPKLTEKLVEPGQQVVVFGIYDDMRRGLLPPRGSIYANRLKPGTAAEVGEKIRSSLLSNLIGGIVVLVLLHGAIAFAVMNFAREKADAPPVDNDVRVIRITETMFS